MTTNDVRICIDEFVSFDDVRDDLTTLRETWREAGYNTSAGHAFYKTAAPIMNDLAAVRDWASNIGPAAKAELRAAMGRAIRSGRLVRGTPPTKSEAERVCLEQHEIACGVWVFVKNGEIIGAEVVDFPSHDGAGWRGWKLAA